MSLRAAQPLPPDAFGWLTDGRLALAELAEDAIDTVRALRRRCICASARSAGNIRDTTRSSSIATAAARSTPTPGRERLYLLELSDPISAGEANIASSEVERTGDLRISFSPGGSFSAPGAMTMPPAVPRSSSSTFRRGRHREL